MAYWYNGSDIQKLLELKIRALQAADGALAGEVIILAPPLDNVSAYTLHAYLQDEKKRA